MKKRKTSSSNGHVSKFRKQVKSEQDELLSTLDNQRAQMLSISYHLQFPEFPKLLTVTPGIRNSEAADFSQSFIGLIEQALGSPTEHDSRDVADDPSLFVQSHPLFSYQESVLSLSKTVIDSVDSIRKTLIPILDRDLELGRGWERDGTDAVDVLLEGRQSTHDRLLATIVEGYGGDKTQDESDKDPDIEQKEWKTTTRKARKGIRKLMNSLNVPLPDSEGEGFRNKDA